MRVLPWVEFTQPDARVPHFSPHGLLMDARMYDEASAEFVQRMIVEIEVRKGVPDAVRDYFDYARKAFVRGFFAYELFTVGWFVAVLAQEFALGERFLDHVGGQVTFRHKKEERTEIQTFSTFGDLAQSHRRASAYPPNSWTIDEAPEFRPSFAWLLGWAHDNGILQPWLDARWEVVRAAVRQNAMTGGIFDEQPKGWATWDHARRSRWFDTHGRADWEQGQIDVVSDIRNLVAHPTAPMLITPVDAVRQIQASAQFISMIWSSSWTP